MTSLMKPLKSESVEQGSGAAESADASAITPCARPVTSQELFRGARQLIIVHQNDEYRLRITRLGKLILTK